MTEPFVVPPELVRTGYVYHEKYEKELGRDVVLAIDLPALCRQEAQKALDYAVTWKGNYQSCAEYLEARFPCDHAWSDPSKSAPPVTCLKCGTPKVIRFPEAAPEHTHTYVGDSRCPGCAAIQRTADANPLPQPSAEPRMRDGFDFCPPVPVMEMGTNKCVGCDHVMTSEEDLRSHKCVTPSAGERCAWCGTTSGNHGVLCAATRRAVEDAQHRDTVPTPTEGERCDCVLLCKEKRTGQPVEGCLVRVPTPSAGEEPKSCPRCGTSGRHSVQCEAMTATIEQRIAEDRKVGVSAGETKRRCMEWGGNCGKLEGHRGAHGLDAAWYDFPPSVGARPEACGAVPPDHEDLRCLLPLGHDSRHETRKRGRVLQWEATFCTACACEKCVKEAERAYAASITPAERDFLKELAEEVNGRPPIDFFDSATFQRENKLRAAARKVVQDGRS